MISWIEMPEGKEKWQAYYASPEWARRRLPVKERSGGICERCKTNKAEAVHHLTYARKFNEPPEDLMHVCEDCHRYFHQIPKNSKEAVMNEMPKIPFPAIKANLNDPEKMAELVFGPKKRNKARKNLSLDLYSLCQHAPAYRLEICSILKQNNNQNAVEKLRNIVTKNFPDDVPTEKVVRTLRRHLKEGGYITGRSKISRKTQTAPTIPKNSKPSESGASYRLDLLMNYVRVLAGCKVGTEYDISYIDKECRLQAPSLVTDARNIRSGNRDCFAREMSLLHSMLRYLGIHEYVRRGVIRVTAESVKLAEFSPDHLEKLYRRWMRLNQTDKDKKRRSADVLGIPNMSKFLYDRGFPLETLKQRRDRFVAMRSSPSSQHAVVNEASSPKTPPQRMSSIKNKVIEERLQTLNEEEQERLAKEYPQAEAALRKIYMSKTIEELLK